MDKEESRVFRTYCKGDGKKPVDKHKNIDSVRSFDECQEFDSFGGILHPDVVDISFDSIEMFEHFLDMVDEYQWNCYTLYSTHGGHSYWKDSKHIISKGGADKKLAVGFVADIHNGETYIPLKVDGVTRDVAIELPDDVSLQEIPEELYPVNTKYELAGMSEGDGRNDDLFKYINVLRQQYSMTPDVIRRILSNTNKHVFKSPLEQSELDIILRDEAFENEILPEFYSGTKFLHDVFAEWFIKTKQVCIINNQLHIYKDGIYQCDHKALEREIVKIIPLKKTALKDLMYYMELVCETKTPSDARYVGFTNGIFDVQTMTLLPYSPDIVVTNLIPWEYNPDAYSEVMDNVLNKLSCGDDSIRALLEECIGACFYRSNTLGGGKSFILTGDRSNGKSTFLKCIHNVLGDVNISSLDLSELGGQFNTAMLYSKLANIGDDIGDEYIDGKQGAIYKKLVTGERLKAERKGQDPFEFNSYAKLLFSANDIPRIKDKTGAVLRRMIIIPFNASFSKSDPDYDPYISHKLKSKECNEYLIKLGLVALHRVITEGFTSSSVVEEQLERYEESNNPVIGFLADFGEDNILHQQVRDVYAAYKLYCTENNMTPMANQVFTRWINKKFKYKVVRTQVNGDRYKVFEEDK